MSSHVPPSETRARGCGRGQIEEARRAARAERRAEAEAAAARPRPGLSGSKRPGGYSDSHGGGKTTARDPLSGGPAKKKKRDDGYDAPSKPQHRPSDPRDPRKGGGGGGGTNKSKGPPQVKMNFVNEMLQANVEIRFVQDNPKRAGTKSYDLYEARERPQTVARRARAHHAQLTPPPPSGLCSPSPAIQVGALRQ